MVYFVIRRDITQLFDVDIKDGRTLYRVGDETRLPGRGLFVIRGDHDDVGYARDGIPMLVEVGHERRVHHLLVDRRADDRFRDYREKVGHSVFHHGRRTHQSGAMMGAR